MLSTGDRGEVRAEQEGFCCKWTRQGAACAAVFMKQTDPETAFAS